MEDLAEHPEGTRPALKSCLRSRFEGACTDYSPEVFLHSPAFGTSIRMNPQAIAARTSVIRRSFSIIVPHLRMREKSSGNDMPLTRGFPGAIMLEGYGEATNELHSRHAI